MDALIFTFLLYGLKAASSFHAAIYEYHAIDTQKTWYDAQQHCRTHYTDLATFRNMEDIERFQRPASFTGNAWIGLFDDPASWKRVMGNESNSWRWSSTGTTSPGGYQNWLSSEPDHHGATNYCGLIRDGLWGDGGCTSQLPFVCFTESPDGSRHFTLVSAGKTWSAAQTHCRQYFTDLATIRNEAENAAVASVLVASQWTWFGLYRRPWRWSDGSTSPFRRWLPGQPNNGNGNQHCVWESDARYWNDMPCSNLQPFVCAKGE
uniref:C-type lectin domain-containing protein n=1 Tax=Knipowitschia caucasica TaxID=637954 RepID=A0AAV2LVU6_KNICA